MTCSRTLNSRTERLMKPWNKPVIPGSQGDELLQHGCIKRFGECGGLVVEHQTPIDMSWLDPLLVHCGVCH